MWCRPDTILERQYENLVRITFGDEYKDGHGHSKTVNLMVNKSREEIVEAYKRSCALTKVSLGGGPVGELCGVNYGKGWRKYTEHEIFTEYESTEISPENQKRLIDAGMSLDNLPDIDEPVEYKEGEEFYMNEYGYPEFYMRFIKLSIPDLEWEFIKEEKPPDIHVGSGYGLFYD